MSRSRRHTSARKRETMGSCRSNRIRDRLQSWSECSNGSSYPGSQGVVDLYPPKPSQPPSTQMVCQVAVGRLYRTTGSPVLGKGL